MKKLSASELEGKLRGKKNWGQKFKGSPWAMGPKVAPPLYTSIELILDVIDTHILRVPGRGHSSILVLCMIKIFPSLCFNVWYAFLF